MKANICNRCSVSLEDSNWHPSAKKRRWLICKSCANIRQNKYNQANPEVVHKQNNQRRYGITYEKYQQMLLNQNGVCAICSNPENSRLRRNLSIDHCHKTNEIRGLLCSECNIGLGKFKDSIILLDKAKEYLNARRTH